MRLFCLFLSALPIWADQRSVAGSFSTTLPNTATFNAVGTFRLEMRLTDLETAADATDRRNIFIPQGGLQLRILENTQVIQADNPAGLGTSTIRYYDPDSIPTKADVLFRYQFRRLTSTTARVSMAVWDTATMVLLDYHELSVPTTTSASTVNFAGAAYLSGNSSGLLGCKCEIAWLRWYDTVAMPDEPPGNLAGGNILDWEFGDSLTDSVLSQAWSGSATYSNTPVYLTLPVHRYGRSGWPITVDLRQAEGSAYGLRITSKTGATFPVVRTTATTGVFSVDAAEPGSYGLEARATIGGTDYTQAITVGAVRRNSSGVVDAGSATLNFLLGPLRDVSAIDVTGYRWKRIETLLLFGRKYQGVIDPDWNTPLAGTVTVTNGSTTVTGSGTSFQSNFACNGTDSILIRYPYGDGSLSSAVHTVSSCASQTSLTISSAYAGANASGVAYQKADSSWLTRWTGDSNTNYYDSVLGQYQNYYATRDPRFRDYARTLAEIWWANPRFQRGDKVEGIGTSHSLPRQLSYLGMWLYALDLAEQGGTTNTNRATAIKKWLNHNVDLTFYLYVSNQTPAAQPAKFGNTPREAAYATLYAALLGQDGVSLAGTVNTSGTAVTWVSGDKFNLYNMAGKTVTINGSSYTVSSVASATSMTLQSSAGTQSGVTFAYDTQAHWRALVNDSITSYWRPWQCQSGNPSPRCSDTWSNGAYRGGDALYTGNASLPWHDMLMVAELYRLFGLSWFTESSTLDTILAEHGAYIKDGVAKTGGGASTPKVWIETTGYLSLPCRMLQYWSYATASTSGSDADGNATGSGTTTCATKDEIESGRTRGNEVAAAYAVFVRTSTTAYRDLGDKMFAAAFGGDDGTEADGVGGYGLLPPYGANTWSVAGTRDAGKQIGQGGRSSLMAWALRANDLYTAGGTVTMYLGFTLPSGTDRVFWETKEGRSGTCLTSPCSITTEARLGTIYRLTYRNGGTDKAVGDWTAMRVQ